MTQFRVAPFTNGMSRYFFHVRNDVSVDDEEGLELPDLAAVRNKACEGVRDLVCEGVRRGEVNLEHYVFVTDERGQEILRLKFGEAFKIVDEVAPGRSEPSH